MSFKDHGISARRAVGYAGLLLLTAAVLDSGPMLAAAQSLGGVEGEIATAFAKPINSFAKITHLNEPREALLSALGRPDNTGGSSLTQLAANVPVPRPTHLETGAPKPAPVALPPLRVGTAAKPLRVLVTGDSLSEYLGQQLIQLTAHDKTIVGKISTHNGTGLARPDVYDWAKAARKIVAQSDPDVVIVALGANDDQGIAMPGPIALHPGEKAWAAEYERRAQVVMRIMLGKGDRRVYWLGLPIVRDAKMDHDYRALDQALKTAASQVPGVTYVDMRGISQIHDKYSDYLYIGGKRVLARQPDGIHFTYEGSKIPAEKVLETAAPVIHYTEPKPAVKKPSAHRAPAASN